MRVKQVKPRRSQRYLGYYVVHFWIERRCTASCYWVRTRCHKCCTTPLEHQTIYSSPASRVPHMNTRRPVNTACLGAALGPNESILVPQLMRGYYNLNIIGKCNLQRKLSEKKTLWSRASLRFSKLWVRLMTAGEDKWTWRLVINSQKLYYVYWWTLNIEHWTFYFQAHNALCTSITYMIVIQKS